MPDATSARAPGGDGRLLIEARGRGAEELVLDVPRWLNEEVRRIPGRYFDWRARQWRAPLSVHAAVVAGELLDDDRLDLHADPEVLKWLGGPSRWYAEATIVELADGPRLQITTLLGEPPPELAERAEPRPGPTAAPEPGGEDDDAVVDDARRAFDETVAIREPGRRGVHARHPEQAPGGGGGPGVRPRARHLLPFTAEGARLLQEIPGVSVEPAAAAACAELATGRVPAAATVRLGEDDEGRERLELLPGWSDAAHRAFADLPEAAPVEDSSDHLGGGAASRHRRPDGDVDPSHTYAVPADPSLLPGLEALLEAHPSIQLTPTAGDRLGGLRVEHAEYIETIELSKADHARPVTRTRAGEPLELGGTLEPFQHAGVRYVLQRRRSFLADEQGLGKTVQTLAALEVDDAFPAVVVCPAGMKLTWEREANTWLPDRTVAVLQGRGGGQWKAGRAGTDDDGETSPAEADIVVLNYEIVGDHHDQLVSRAPRAAVFDESHYCKAPTAKRTKNALRLARAVPEDGLRLALTGTPVLNRPSELTAQLRLVGRLEEFGSGAELARRFRGPESHDRLHWHLRARGYVRRLKVDVLPQLPAKRRTEVPLQLSNQEEYRLAEQDVVAWLRTQPLDLSELDAKVAAALRAEQLVKLNHLRRLAARGKLPGALTWIADFLASGEPLVVFATHVEIQKAVTERFPDALHLLGEDDPASREQTVRRFQEGPPPDDQRDPTRGANLVVCSMRAAAQGITLTRASNVCFLELDWTPAMHDQAEDRCHRIGQRDAVTAWYLLARSGIDRDMDAVLRAKREVIDAVVDGRHEVAEPVSLAVVRALRARG